MDAFRIIYTQDDGRAAVIVPSPDAEISIEEIARKDVPAGLPYKIVPTSDIPDDRTFRDAWECVIDVPDGYGIGHAAWFAERGIII
jgi:hypothetical protein